MDGHTYVCTDGYLRPTLLGRLRRVHLEIAKIFKSPLGAIQGHWNCGHWLW